jgi:hypothetical protein
MSEHIVKLRNSVNEVIKSISPNRTPPRSRANSIGGSQDDDSAPPTEERIQEARLIMTQGLIDAGFISPEPRPHHHKPIPPKITSVMPN